MMKVRRGTTAILNGSVAGAGNISAWVLTLQGLEPNTDFVKSSTDSSQIVILDPDARTFAVYLGLDDTATARYIWVELRAVDGPRHHLLFEDVLLIEA